MHSYDSTGGFVYRVEPPLTAPQAQLVDFFHVLKGEDMTIVSEDGRFEWDSAKDKENRRKHLLSFEEILDVFDDPAFLEIDDVEHSVFEERFRGIGSIRGIVIITTC